MQHTGGARGKGDLEVAVQYAGPAVLPWLWHPLEQDGETVLLPAPIPHYAGPDGTMPFATLGFACHPC